MLQRVVARYGHAPCNSVSLRVLQTAVRLAAPGLSWLQDLRGGRAAGAPGAANTEEALPAAAEDRTANSGR